MSGISTSTDKKRMIVQLKQGISAQAVNPFVQVLEGQVIRIFKYLPFIAIEVSENKLQTLMENDAVFNIFEDGQAFALEQQLPWGVDRIDAELVQQRYGIKGFGVKVAVIDTGIDQNHPDLKAYGGASFITSTFQDDNGHGTHVAGTIAALDNGEGVLGVAPEAQIYALKVLNSAGSGNYSDIAAAIEWSIDNGMNIISMSLGGSSPSELLRAAVVKAHQAGILIIAAAGNAGNDTGTGDNVLYPARYPEVIAVAATDSSDKRASFSSTGPDVELAAPGVNILSTFPGGIYKALNGTSMAAPHITGLAALIKSTYPNLTNEQIRKKLSETALDLGQAGRDPWYGYGLATAPAAVQQPGPDVSPPQIFFKSPDANETVSGNLKIELLAQDLSGVKNLKLSIDGTLVGSWSAPPYIYYWDTTGVKVGAHKLAVEAVDGVGNTGKTEEQIYVGATVTMLEPREGIVVKDNVIIRAAFSGNAVVNTARLYVDGIFKQSKSLVNNQVEFNWNSREVRLPGTSNHSINIIAVTDTGLQTSGKVNVVIRNPVVTIVQPEADTRVNGRTLSIIAHVTDADGIEKVEFLMDNKNIGTVAAYPYKVESPVHNLSVGNHVLKAIAYSKTGHIAESREVILKKPTGINFVAPLDGKVIGGKYNVTVDFLDPVKSADLFIDNIYLGKKTVNGLGPVSWVFDTTGFQELTTVAVKVNAITNADEVLSSAKVMVTIDNYLDWLPPKVAVVSPQNGYLIDKPQVEITAEAIDEKGIRYVEFYLDGTPLQKVWAPPYTIVYDFTSIAVGRHYLSAKAEDTSGNIGVSDSVEIARPTAVTIISPADDSKVEGTVKEFKITCADQIIGPVKLFIDGTLCQTIKMESPTTGPVVIPYLWDTGKYPDFTDHTIAVEVQTFQDLVPSKGVAVVTVDNSADRTPPVVNLSSSQTGTVQGMVLFTAVATDNTRVQRVELYINGNLASSDQDSPYEYQWDSSKATTGNYSFLAKAFDPIGNSGLSNVINLSIPTKVSIVSPAAESYIVGVFTDFIASFADPILGNVNLYIDGNYKAATEVTVPTGGPVKVNYNWDTSAYPQLTQHDIMITAATAKDQILSSGTVKVYVDNRSGDSVPPTVTLTASTSRVIAGELVTLYAKATDNTGISRVEFYKNDSLTATLSKAPYNYVWNTAGQSVGVYSFVAKAYDLAGNVTTSNQMNVNIATTVTIIYPKNGQVVSGVINKFTAQFGDPVSGYVYLFIDNNLMASKSVGATTGPVTLDYNWNTASHPNGSTHLVRIRAYTDAGRVVSEAYVKVTVQN